MIPILDLKAQYATIREEIDAAIRSVIESADFILGKQVRQLEADIAAFCETSHGVGVASGTDALRLALSALGIGLGDEVITTAFTFIATANTISRAGARPVFVDIDPRTYNLDVSQIESAITPATRAIVPVHLYGQPADMGPVLEIARRRNLYVIEDCAQAIGARYAGRRVGSLGDAGCLSFFPSKNLGGYGDGGMVLTNSSDIASRIDLLRRHGCRAKYHADVVGFNSRLDTLQAAIVGVKLRHLEKWNADRRRIAAQYTERLSDVQGITTPFEQPGSHHVYHQYTIRAERRDGLAEFLKTLGVSTMVYYPAALHRQRLYADLGYREGSLPHAEAASREVLSLPMYPELTESQIETVTGAIGDYYSGNAMESVVGNRVLST